MSRQIKPGNSERGWNDPPMISYGGGGSNSAPKRSALSKRVAFPQNTSPAPVHISPHLENYKNPCYTYPNAATTSLLPPETAQAQNVQLLPPSYSAEPPCYSGPVIVPSMLNPLPCFPNIPNESVSSLPPLQIHSQPLINNLPTLHMAKDPMSDLPVAAVPDDSELQLPSFSDDEQMFHYCVTRLQRALNECHGTSEKRVIDEMQKKLNIFSDMWKHKQISYPVQSTMARLATAIHRRKCTAANDLHLYLMMEHFSEVSKWLVGIKRLVQEIEKVPQQPTSPSVSCSQDDHNSEQLLQQQEDSTMLADDPRTFFQYDMVQAAYSFHPIESFNNHYQHQTEVSPVEQIHLFNDPQQSQKSEDQVPLVDSLNEMAVLSTSPGSVFEPLKIAQCFDGHGELQMRYIEDEKPISESLFFQRNVIEESVVSTANAVIAISSGNVGNSTLVGDLMVNTSDSNSIGIENQQIHQLVELTSIPKTEENAALFPVDIHSDIGANIVPEGIHSDIGANIVPEGINSDIGAIIVPEGIHSDIGANIVPEGINSDIDANIVPEGIHSDIGANIVPEGIHSDIGANIVPEGIHSDIGANIIPEGIRSDIGANIVPEGINSDIGANIVPEGINSDIDANIVPEGIRSDIGANIVPEGIRSDIGANIVPEGIRSDIGANIRCDVNDNLKSSDINLSTEAAILGFNLSEIGEKLNEVILAKMSEKSETDSLYPECGSVGSVDDLEVTDLDSVTDQVEQDPYNSICGSFEIKQLNAEILRPFQADQEDGDVYLSNGTLEDQTTF